MKPRFALLAIASAAFAGSALAGNYNNAASYNAGYGMSSGQENQAANPNLRDQNGNLTVVDGQFTSSTYSQSSGVQSASAGYSGGVGNGGGTYGTATAIGNSLNVVTVGSYNTVIVNSTQINTGNQSATANTNGSSAQ